MWKHLNNNYVPLDIFDMVFKIRHRRYFIRVVLHQIYKDMFTRSCSVCYDKEEDFEHLVLYCEELCIFRDRVRLLLEFNFIYIAPNHNKSSHDTLHIEQV